MSTSRANSHVQSRDTFLQFARLLPDPFMLLDSSAVIYAANRAALDCFKAENTEAVEGRTLMDLVADPSERVLQYVKSCARTRTSIPTGLLVKPFSGETIEYRIEGARYSRPDEAAAILLRFIPKQTANQAFVTLNQQIRDISEVRRTLVLKSELIERQRLEILNLASAVIEIWDDILLVPLQGEISSDRMMHITERLLHRITEVQAEWVIVDLTGIHRVDDESTESLLMMAKAVRLIGSCCVMTGLSPVLAASLSQLNEFGKELVVTRALRDALRHCMGVRYQKRR